MKPTIFMKTKPSLSFSLFHPRAALPCRLRLVVLLGALSVAGRAIAADATDVFYGPGAGASTSSGQDNTAIGYSSLHSNTSGDDNTASGYAALYSNTTGYDNTATGRGALLSNSTGSGN